MGTTRTTPKEMGPQEEKYRLSYQPQGDKPHSPEYDPAHVETWKPGDPKLPGYDYPGEPDYEADRDPETEE